MTDMSSSMAALENKVSDVKREVSSNATRIEEAEVRIHDTEKSLGKTDSAIKRISYLESKTEDMENRGRRKNLRLYVKSTTAPPTTQTSTTTIKSTTAPPTTQTSNTTIKSTTAPPTTQTSNTTKPDVIRNLTASEITTSSVFLNWEKPSGRYSFEVQWTGDTLKNQAKTNESCYNITGLTAGVKYTINITALAADNSTEVHSTSLTYCTKPNVVENLEASKITSSSVSLKWEEPLGKRSFFEVQWTHNKTDRSVSDDTSLTHPLQSHPLQSNDTSFTITDLNAGNQYRFCITAFATDGLTKGKSTCILQITEAKEEKPNNAGMIAGIILGLFCCIFIIIILFIYSRRTTMFKKPSDIPFHDIRSQSSSALKIEDYEEYFKKKQADSNCGFAEEYEELKTAGTEQSQNSALAMENKPKNRFTNVLPYDISRVKLSICGSPFDDYINANFIPGYNSRKEYIAAQGPLPVTVNEFWRMIWEKNVYTLVMLTKCNEQGRVKCEKYWPSGTSHYRNIAVTILSEITMECWTIRDFSIKNMKTAETRNIRQFHFTVWPDHGVPQNTEVLIDFRHLVREHIDQYSRHSPTIVHCSAGVGRTGTFIAIDHLIFQIERESKVDIYGIVHDMRMHRTLMVQTEDQYVYLHQCAYAIIRSRTGTNVDLIYQNTAALHCYENVQLKKPD